MLSVNSIQSKVCVAVIGTVGGIVCLIASGDKKLQERYLFHQNNISKIGLSLGAIMLSCGTWLYCHQVEEDLKEAEHKSTNQQQLRQHFETLKVENATHKMNLDAQLARAKADFITRQKVALLREEMGFDLSESAAYHLEEQQYRDTQESTDKPVINNSSLCGNQEADTEATESLRGSPSGNHRQADSTKLEALKARFLEKLEHPENPPLFENLERSEKLEVLRLVLREKLGIENTIFLCWGIKPGGRNHDKYQDARAMLNLMVEELNQQGFTEDNN